MEMSSRRIRVLIVDDSAVVRQILARELARDPMIEVIGTAADPFIARDKILRDRPDVLTLDIEMPKMDGLTFLKKVMTFHPMPVIVLSSLAASGANLALEALECGAFEVFAKPTCNTQNFLPNSIDQLAEAIKAAAHAELRPPKVLRPCIDRPKPARISPRPTEKVIVIGASTGGTEALRTVLSALPADSPGVLAVIHMPEVFTQRFAERLNNGCEIEVREACDGDAVHAGLALIARGDHHLVLSRTGTEFQANVRKGPLICGHRPSVEALFHSTARCAGSAALGIIMTGMGSDGADGLLAMRQAGAHTIAQNEASSVVFGMPKEAIQRGAAEEILGLDCIAQACVRWSGISRQKT